MKSNKDVVFLLVDADGNLERSEAFMTKNHYELPLYIPAGPIPKELFSGSLPTTVVLNKEGEVVFRHEGMGDYDTEEVVQFIEKLSM